ncbi:MAG: universal stress protein [Rubrivivax sp.]|nr:universal stress protein [Rubrivivax sp.]
MTPLRSIVAATDLSAPSRHACERAALLAAADGAALMLVQALSASALADLQRWIGVGGGGEHAAPAVEAEARTKLEAFAEDLARRHGISVAAQLLTGHVVEQVTRQVDAQGADLVVTGTRGAGFFRGVVVGATAERIARCSSRPVLMVRRSPHDAYRTVLVPVDFSPWSAEAIALARRVAPGARLVLMHAAELPFEGKMRFAGVDDATLARYRLGARKEAAQRLGELAAQAGVGTPDASDPAAGAARLVTVDGADPWMLIVQQEEEFDCDLVVIGRQGRHAVDEWLLGSTTRMVLAEGNTDVLMVTRAAA